MADKVKSSAVSIKKKKGNIVRYNKWGYIFLIPFFAVFIVFNLIPLGSTIYYSFFEKMRVGLTEIGPNFIGFDNYKFLFTETSILKYAGNTAIMWVMGFIPQILVSLLLASWFSDTRLRLKGSRFFKTVIYLPNIIMASAFAVMFYALFTANGPINMMLQDWGVIKEPIRFLQTVWGARGLVALMNFLMWFGNTTILLMAGIMGIDVSLYEAAEVDGANSVQRFWKITLPLLKPILIYVVITSLIGGIQMFDVPQILTKGSGDPITSTKTLVMFLNDNISISKNYGRAGAVSVLLFMITMILSLTIYFVMYRNKGKED